MTVYDDILDKVLHGQSIDAIQQVWDRGRSGISLLEAKKWVEDFTERVAVPVARGERPRDAAVREWMLTEDAEKFMADHDAAFRDLAKR